jgi:hypothetical protein
MELIMSLREFKTAYEEFWENQNNILLAHPAFIKGKGTIFDDVFYFRHKSGGEAETKIDFSIFDLSHIKLKNTASVHIDEQLHMLSAKEYAKLFFVSALPARTSLHICGVHQMITHIFAFLNKKHLLSLSFSDLELFWSSFLSKSVNEKGFFRRLSPPNYSGTINCAQLPKIRLKLQLIGVVGVIDKSLTIKKVESILDNVCQSLYSITLNEYKKGGTFNFLGLELGQYYVDYLRQVYQQDYLFMSICKNTINKMIEKYHIYGLDEAARYNFLNVLLSAFTSFEPYKSKRVTENNKLNVIFNETQEFAFGHYQKIFESTMSLHDESIEKLVIELGLETRFDAVEVIRILMLQKFHGLGGSKNPEQVWKGYLVSLDKTFLESNKLTNTSVDSVYAKMHSLVLTKKVTKDIFLYDMKTWGENLLKRANTHAFRSFKAELNTIIHAMSTLVVAWLGYRKSEFGFPLSAIHIEPNLDILDNSHVPFRFKLKWIVPKNSGITKIEREITSQCFQIAVQLHELFDPSDGAPCLYESTKSRKLKVSNMSGAYIDTRVKSNWFGFIYKYRPFNEALKLDSLMQKNAHLLSKQEKQSVVRLKSIYDINSARYKHLLSTANKVRQDWKRLSCTSFNSPRAQANLKASLESISKTGETSNHLHQEIIETYLPDEYKALLCSGQLILDQKNMHDISEVLLEGANYPTPHSFRHIWAEAILTRYQGDVGSVIRHQFCHLDSSFFMAYLRDKDARGLLKGARKRYLNSITNMLILDSDKVGKEYLGGFARYVKKATELTKPVCGSEIRALRESINGRIISVQPSLFSICVPRDGGEKRAKCATFGNINPQDAKPEFCLNCTNAVITSGNVRGIWTTIQPMVKDTLNENTLGFMLEGHLPTLRSGYRRIKELQPTHPNKDAISKILNAIEKAIVDIELKLKQEGFMHV